MKILHPVYYDRFSCAAGRCSDTCCACWEIVVDPAHVRLYDSLPGPLGEAARAHLRRDADGTPYLSLNAQGRCALLRPDGLCALQAAYGADALNDVCRRYPRFRYEFGARTELGISISCPTACALVLSTPFALLESVEDVPPSLNDIDPQRFYAFLRGQDTAFSIAADARFPVFARMALLLDFAGVLSRSIGDPAPASDAFAPAQREARLAALAPKRRADFTRLRDLFAGMEPLSPEFPAQLSALTHPAPFADPVEAERLLQYYVYKYFLQSAYDGRLLANMQFAAASLLLLGALLEDAPQAQHVDIIHRFARETEHSEESLAAFRRFAGVRRQTYFRSLLLAAPETHI